MRIIQEFVDIPEACKGAAIALGNFDGVHKGHQVVIGKIMKISNSLNIPSAVMTFEPHPRRFFQPNAPLFEMTPTCAKSRCIEALGVDIHYVIPFNKKFSSLNAQDFIEKVLVTGLRVRHVAAGYDFVFGKGREGDVEYLKKSGETYGFDVTVVPAVKTDNCNTYSSTVIREHISEGRPLKAAEHLGHVWEIEGKVVAGDQRGRQIGFPTANVDPGVSIIPKLGVYAVWAGVPKGLVIKWYKAVVNVGRRPTFDGEGITIEAHLFDFTGDLYDKVLRVAFIDFIRPEMKFDGLESIKTQILEDCIAAQEILDEVAFNDITTQLKRL